MQFNMDKVTEKYTIADEFCQEFSIMMKQYSLGNVPKKKPKM